MKLTTITHVSVDGVMQDLGGPDEDRRDGFERGGWALPLFVDETATFLDQVFQRADGFLFGRLTFEIFMANSAKHEAAIPNPALKPLSVLVGEWTTLGSHPGLPGTTLHGHAKFEWIEGSAFLMMHWEIDEPGIPSAIAIFGSDDALETLFMLYFNERGVSRKYEMTLRDNIWNYWRNAPGFSQRFTGTFGDNGNTIVGVGELSKEGSTWEPDLQLTFTRVK